MTDEEQPTDDVIADDADDDELVSLPMHDALQHADAIIFALREQGYSDATSLLVLASALTWRYSCITLDQDLPLDLLFKNVDTAQAIIRQHTINRAAERKAKAD